MKLVVEAGGQTEISIDEYLTSLSCRAESLQRYFFDTIAGYAQVHGAIVHYEANALKPDVALKQVGSDLDRFWSPISGWNHRTTRTIALGPVTEEMKHVYTLGAERNISNWNLRNSRWRIGHQLDAGDACGARVGSLDGTGHGVGACLSVHEGPHQIRMEWK